MRRTIYIVTLVLALIAVNWSIYQKEQLLENGQIVLLKLAPVDPRSLMQGDYMILNFELGEDVIRELADKGMKDRYSAAVDGFVHIELDSNRVAQFVSTSTERSPSSEIALQFRLRSGQVKFATNAYFFQEGTADKLNAAQYGEFRVAESGELILSALRDAEFNQL
ncbi:GDYXXLXY domain-containing protein [Vibrio europaeus]|uniref:GDYXXLXY domain-containing protein n=1 Tax=Vibrio europaeus TaxID=300876 RepID=UPI00148D8EAE|nr:GDYXXLXY domain-containing protein [Vibrio europaeus]NOH24063.1 GDYXXLXY domain-containing protein [Vibrio europaeus]